MVLHKPAPVESLPLKLEDVPCPEPKPSEVLIRVSACGVCHTDLHIVEGEVRPRSLPLIPGHQVVGVIESVGTGKASEEARIGDYSGGIPKTLKRTDGENPHPGMRVGMPWLYKACGECSYCKSGLENLCDDPRFTGLDVNGGYAEYIVAPADFVVPIPDIFSDEEAAPLLCAGIIGYRSLRVSGLLPGERIGLFGFGASAHLALQVARYWGCEVYVFTRSREHQDLARSLGAAWAGTADDVPPRPLDRAITFAPAGGLIPRALKNLRKGGTLAINAIHMDGLPEMPYDLLYWERSIKSVANSTREDAFNFMEVAAAIPIRVKTEAFPLEKANEALLQLKERKIQGSAVLFIPSR